MSTDGGPISTETQSVPAVHWPIRTHDQRHRYHCSAHPTPGHPHTRTHTHASFSNTVTHPYMSIVLPSSGCHLQSLIRPTHAHGMMELGYAIQSYRPGLVCNHDRKQKNFGLVHWNETPRTRHVLEGVQERHGAGLSTANLTRGMGSVVSCPAANTFERHTTVLVHEEKKIQYFNCTDVLKYCQKFWRWAFRELIP